MGLECSDHENLLNNLKICGQIILTRLNLLKISYNRNVIMKSKEFIELYKKRGYSEAKITEAVNCIKDFEKYLKNNHSNFDKVSIEDVKKYLDLLVKKNMNSPERIIALARYCYTIGKNDIYIYFTRITGGMGVIENIKKRSGRYAGEDVTSQIFDDLAFVPLGRSVEHLALFTEKLMKKMFANLPKNQVHKILAGNNHNIPLESFKKEKEYYQNSDSLETYLKERHARKVKVLQHHCDTNTVWFEQKITKPVVDFVKENQEILSAVKKGNKLYITKIPYDPENYLKEKDPKKKRYYGCHCPFARESIMNPENNIKSDWCYCSAGFTKLPFEYILDKELDIKVISSILAGDDICRFEIVLPENF